ncbi:APOV1 protein, partial [Smithornis capensis]|nr:APOV1 protein [Smithornis capensis]
MLQSRVLVIALILLLSTTLPEVHSKSIPDKERRDWMVIPDAAASYIYEAVKKVSPGIAQYLVDAAETPVVVATRNFLIRGTTKLSIVIEQVFEKLKYLWQTRFLGY